MSRRVPVDMSSVQCLVLLLWFRESVSAINCFSCSHSSTTVEVTSTCGDAPSSAAGDLNCSGMLCHTVWAEYSAPSNTHRVQECSNNGSVAPPIEDCRGKTVDNKTYFVYQNQCCSTTGQIFNYGTMYRISECYCKTDFCNDVTNFPMNTVGNSPSSDQASSSSSSSSSFSTTTTGQSTNNATPKDYSAAGDRELVTTSGAVWQRSVSVRISHWMLLILMTSRLL